MPSLSQKMKRFVLGLFFFVLLLDYWFRGSALFFGAKHCNTGIAFGVTLPGTLLWIGIGIWLSVAFWQCSLVKIFWERLAWAAIFLGGLANALDRFLHGCVTDYIAIGSFPSFNLADMMLFLGVAYLLGQMTGIFSKLKVYAG